MLTTASSPNLILTSLPSALHHHDAIGDASGPIKDENRSEQRPSTDTAGESSATMIDRPSSVNFALLA